MTKRWYALLAALPVAALSARRMRDSSAGEVWHRGCPCRVVITPEEVP